jgi:alpha-D-ribose 1-methylphosphonate 5-phosphate C-P lyase
MPCRPWTGAVSLDFEDHPFATSKAPHDCDLCGAKDSYLDEVITDDAGGRMFVCSDTDFCVGRREDGHMGRLGADPKALQAVGPLSPAQEAAQ